MNLECKADDYFAANFGVTLDALLAPIDTARPGGESLQGNGVYREIQEARREDDPTLPQGPWVHELKRADWDKVARVAVGALAGKSKDLRVAVWLLEAEIRRNGFAAIAPCVELIRALCERHWEHLHPRIEGADLEYRTNVIHWANEKLLPVLRLVPLTRTGRDEPALTWADWEQAQRNEQLRAAQSGNGRDAADDITPLAFAAAMAATPTEHLAARYPELRAAAASVEALSDTLNRLCANDAPSLHNLAEMLDQIQTLIGAELHKRGVHPNEPAPAGTASEAVEAPAPDAAIRDRASAYARLAEAADYLMRLEPHSPAPYLVKRAIAWGNLNTAELYRDLFVKHGGQINIFELLGLQEERKAGE